MAVHKGRKLALDHAMGETIPTFRVLGPVGKAVIYEMPEATSSVRTIARLADVSVLTTRGFALEADVRATIVGPRSVMLDIAALVVRPVIVNGDLTMVAYGALDLRPDTLAAVFREVEGSFDSAITVLHRVMSDADVKQSIYVYLFRESHEIQI